VDKNKKFFIWVSILVFSVLSMSVLSLTKLGTIGDGDPTLTPLRIINTNIILLSAAVWYIINYLRKNNKQ